MHWIEAKVIYRPETRLIVDELIAEIFTDLGITGVTVEEPDLEPEEGWDPGPVSRPDEYAVTAYFAADEKSAGVIRELEAKINGLADRENLPLDIRYKKVDDCDWAEKWKEYFRPEKVSDSFVVKPTWREYELTGDEKIIEIDPGMAFGTGTHPTTRLCIQLIEEHVRPGDSILDIGTGSGILLVAAAKCGAGKLAGIDNDEVAVATALENLELNKVDLDQCHIFSGNLVDDVSETYDVVVANILAEIVVDLLDNIRGVVGENTRLIFSGILREKAEMVTEKMEQCGFDVTEVRYDEAWSAVTGTVKKAELNHAGDKPHMP